ncbi:MAG: ribosomal-processing cysteine protease Prp [Lachnospiraceae bacterium]|nr:ribosomal-processing cysteine protease Prp [Lachnospiraceae bacterium]
MIKACILFDGNDEPFGFRVAGHAGFERRGKDIVCAAASLLCYTFLSSLNELTDEPFLSEIDEDHGIIHFRFKEKPLERGTLLFQALLGGLCMLEQEYERYIRIQAYRKTNGTFTKINDQEV